MAGFSCFASSNSPPANNMFFNSMGETITITTKEPTKAFNVHLTLLIDASKYFADHKEELKHNKTISLNTLPGCPATEIFDFFVQYLYRGSETCGGRDFLKNIAKIYLFGKSIDAIKFTEFCGNIMTANDRANRTLGGGYYHPSLTDLQLLVEATDELDHVGSVTHTILKNIVQELITKDVQPLPLNPQLQDVNANTLRILVTALVQEAVCLKQKTVHQSPSGGLLSTTPFVQSNTFGSQGFAANISHQNRGFGGFPSNSNDVSSNGRAPFGIGQTLQQTTGGGLFGNTRNTINHNMSIGGSGFGSTHATSIGNSLFGQARNNPSNSLFSQPTPASNFIFGQAPQTTSTTSPLGSNQNAFRNRPSLFGSTNINSQSSNGSLFGSPNVQTQPAGSLFANSRPITSNGLLGCFQSDRGLSNGFNRSQEAYGQTSSPDQTRIGTMDHIHNYGLSSFTEREANGTTAVYKSLGFHLPYQKVSHEEVRLIDYQSRGLGAPATNSLGMQTGTLPNSQSTNITAEQAGIQEFSFGQSPSGSGTKTEDQASQIHDLEAKFSKQNDEMLAKLNALAEKFSILSALPKPAQPQINTTGNSTPEVIFTPGSSRDNTPVNENVDGFVNIEVNQVKVIDEQGQNDPKHKTEFTNKYNLPGYLTTDAKNVYEYLLDHNTKAGCYAHDIAQASQSTTKMSVVDVCNAADELCQAGLVQTTIDSLHWNVPAKEHLLRNNFMSPL